MTDTLWTLFRGGIYTNNHNRIASAVSSRKRVEILAKAKALGVKVTNAKARVTTEA